MRQVVFTVARDVMPRQAQSCSAIAIVFQHDMHRIIETICGVWELARLAMKSRLRLRGKYWTWRHETAFGSTPDKFTTRAQRFTAMIEYGRWVHRMRKQSRK